MAHTEDLSEEERGLMGRTVRGVQTGMHHCLAHPLTKLGFAMGFLIYLYYGFLISVGKVSGVFDPDAQESFSATFFSILNRGCCGLPPVRHARHAPSFQQIPHIKRGYRIGFSPLQLLKSLFTVHNQSGNTWTHLAGAAYVSYVLYHFLLGSYPGLHAMDAVEWLVLLTFLASALACLMCSTLYHLLGCHSHTVYEALFRADLIGIALLIFGSYLPGIFYAYYCFPTLQVVYMVVTVANLIVGLLGAALTDLHCPKQSSVRTLTFAFLVGFGLVPAIHWCLIVPHKVRVMFIDNLAGMFAAYGLGFTFWHTRFPEAFIPNRFDIWCSSHQLWHACIVTAVVVWLHGCLEWHEVLHTEQCAIFDP